MVAGLLCLAAAGQDAADPAADEARSLIDSREFLLAIEAAESAIDGIERSSHRYDFALVGPLVTLGDALAQVGDAPGAQGAYQRALQVTRMNRGLHHPDQVRVIYREAALYTETGDYDAANGRHEHAYEVLLRSHGATNPRLLPGIFVLAEWYLTTYDIFSARGLFEHAQKIALTLGHDNPARLRALRGIADSYRAERFPPGNINTLDAARSSGFSRDQRWASSVAVNAFGRGERALIEVVNVVRAREGVRPEEVAMAMLDLADWFLLFDKNRRADTLYRHIRELLADAPALRERVFANPTPLYLPLPAREPKRGGRTRPPDSGVVELAVAVDAQGGVGRIETLRSEPEGLMDFKVRRAARRAQYRPPFTAEGPQPSDDVRIVFEFRYYPRDEDDEGAAAEPERTVSAAGD